MGPLRYKDVEKLKGMDRLQREAQKLSSSEEPKKGDFFASKEKKNCKKELQVVLEKQRLYVLKT